MQFIKSRLESSFASVSVVLYAIITNTALSALQIFRDYQTNGITKLLLVTKLRRIFLAIVSNNGLCLKQE